MESNKSFYPAIILSAALLICLAFLFQGSRGIWQPDEGYYVGTAMTMMEKHTLLVPYLGEDEIFLDKPPLIYWSIIAGLKLLGHSEFAARFFLGVSFIITALLTGLIGWELFKDKIVGLFAVFIYSTMIVPFLAANFVTPDTLLSLWTTMAILFFWKSTISDGRRPLWQMLLCLTAGVGFLAKGPAVLIPCGGILVFLAVRRQVAEYFRTRWSIIGLALFVIVGLGWYIWVGVEIPGALGYFFDSQLWGRLVSEKYKRNPGLSGALIYLPVLILGSLPWSVIWIEKRALIGSALFTKNWWRTLADRPAALFLLCWFFVPMLILCLASSKLGLYLLPIFPPLAIATAKLWRGKFSSFSSSVNVRIGNFIRPVALCFVWVVLLVFSKLALAYYPTANNMKTLWTQLQDKLPQTDYEICTVDKRADGLLFYGAKTVEHLAVKSNPYPTFIKTESILDEIKEMAREKEIGFLLIQGKDRIPYVCHILENTGVDFHIVNLPYHRALLSLKFSSVKETL